MRTLMQNKMPSLDHPAYAIALGVVIGLILLITLRGASGWDGDDALYIMNARNIVLGLPYAKTAYVLNPDNVINPAAYPPGLPLLLAPIYWLFGASLIKMKALCIVCFAAFIAVYVRILLLYVTPGLALVTALALGLHPYIWDFKDTLYSELPFMLACYAALLLLYRVQSSESNGALILAGAAVAVAFAYLVRAIGIVIFPAAALSAFLQSKRTTAVTLMLLGGAALIILSVQHLFPPDIGTYVGYLRGFSLHGVRMAMLHYLGVRGTLIGPGVFQRAPGFAIGLAAVFGLLVCTGFLARAFRRITIFEFFFVGYLLFLLIYPIVLETNRYSLPVWPLLFLYCASGIGFVTRHLPRLGRHLVAAAISLAVLSCYGAAYAAVVAAPIPYPIEAPQSQAMFAAIRRAVPPGAAVLARRPTTIGLFTGRSATTWSAQYDDDSLLRYMEREHVQYVLLERFPVIELNRDQNATLEAFVHHEHARLVTLFENEWFSLYHLQ